MCFAPQVAQHSTQEGRDIKLYITRVEKKALTNRWPLQERALLLFFDSCEFENKSKLIGTNLVHSLKFFRFVMGPEFDLEKIVSPLMSGKISRITSTKAVTEQARALTVKEVQLLEKRLSTSSNILDKYFTGCLLYAIYTRSRWADMGNIDRLFFDVIETADGPFGFVEARTRIHKTSTTAERKAMYMRYVAPIQGPFGPVCRATRADGAFTCRALTSAEGTSMLNDFIEAVVGSEDETTTHSLKSTTLVWAARDGMDDKSRCLLGHLELPNGSEFEWPLCSKSFKDNHCQESLVEVVNAGKRRRLKATFRKQSGNLGLHQDWIDGLIAVGVSNLGRRVFACGQPGAPTQDVDVTNLLTSTGVVRVISVGDIAIMKRLIFQAQTSVICLVRSQADPNSDPSVWKLPAAERTARVAAQKARLAGLNLEGPLEVAHCVYDLVSGMLEADSLKYVAPNRCVTRLSEITSTKPPKELKLDSNASGIVVCEGQNDQTCPTTSELDIYEAMTRRTDCRASVCMQEMTRDGIKPLPTGDRPLDAVVRNHETDHNVICHMLPTPVAKEKPSEKPTKNPGNDSKKDSKDKGWNWKQWSPKQSWKKSGTGRLPKALKGCCSSSSDGKRLCFAYNINGCDKAQPGERCDKGYHLCATKNCGGKHPHYSCNNRK
eukprot:symbB.v1.2.030424.t1/scaffold3428.1/size56978/3